MFERLPLQDQVYQHLYRQILNNEFEKNVLYSESDLAKTLNVSRTPIHAALARLQKEGYVDIYSSRGFQLHNVTAEELQESFQSGVAEEAYCIYLMSRNPRRSSVIPYLEADIREHESALSKNDIEAFIESDTRFHTRFFEASGNSIFQENHIAYRYRCHDILVTSLARPNRMADSIADHRQIVSWMKEEKPADLNLLYELLERHHDDFP